MVVGEIEMYIDIRGVFQGLRTENSSPGCWENGNWIQAAHGVQQLPLVPLVMTSKLVLSICHLDSGRKNGDSWTVSVKEASWVRQTACKCVLENNISVFRFEHAPFKDWRLVFMISLPAFVSQNYQLTSRLRTGQMFPRNTAVGRGHQGRPLASVWACQLHPLLHTSLHLGVRGCGPVRKPELSASLESWWVDIHIWMQLCYSIFELP